MNHKILFVLLTVLLSACASNRGGYTKSSDVESRLNQLTEAEVAMKLGAPTDKVSLSDGGSVWTYRDKSAGLTGGECTVSLVIKNGHVVSSTVTARDRSWVSYPLGSCVNILSNLD
jgi:hypothetical protein